MKKLLFTLFLICIMGVGSKVTAFQEVHYVNVVSTYMDHSNDLCTIVIAQNHPVTTITAQCNRRTFSWKCLPDDYRFELARISAQNNSPIKIRYSEYSCQYQTGNMHLLTAW